MAGETQNRAQRKKDRDQIFTYSEQTMAAKGLFRFSQLIRPHFPAKTKLKPCPSYAPREVSIMHLYNVGICHIFIDNSFTCSYHCD